MGSAGVGIVEMSYNYLFHGVVGNLGLQDIGKLHFAFPCPVTRVIHDEIGSYAYFHDVFCKLDLNFIFSRVSLQ